MSKSVPGHGGAVILIILATALWGTSFPLMKVSMGDLSASAITLMRFTVAAASVVFLVRGDRRLWLAAAEMTVILWAGYATQAIGLQYTTVNRSAFLTSSAVLFVPFIEWIVGRRLSWPVWACAALAMVGVGLLCYDGSAPNVGDLWTVGTAIVWAIFICRLERMANRFDVLALSVALIFGVMVASMVWVGIERPTITVIPWAAMLWLGIACTAIPTCIQTYAQQRITSAEAAILYMLEPVWAALWAWLWMSEVPGPRGIIGGLVIILAAVACQRVNGARSA